MKSFFQFYEHLKLIKEEKYESREDVDGYIDADKLIGERVWVHTNRTHRDNNWNGMIGIYSTTEYGKKTGNAGRYTNEIRLKSPIVFQTSKSGAKRIQQNDKRELIAGVSGVVVTTNRDISGMDEITYNPKGLGYFHIKTKKDEKDEKILALATKEILTASEVYFNASENGEYKIFAKDIKFKEPEDNKPQTIPLKEKPENLLFPKDSTTQQFEPTKSRDFLGYHASKSDKPSGVVDPMYGSHFRELLDSMPWKYRDYALKQGWLDADIEDDDHTSKEIANWLSRENIGMIFVSHDQPYVDSLNLRRKGNGATYGHNAFYVMLPEKDRLAQIMDTAEHDASIVLYNRNNPPKFIPIEKND